MSLSPPRAWAEINRDALRHNFEFARSQSGNLDVMAVVKANAYGHGVKTVVETLEELRPAFYGVANVREAREVKELIPNARVYLLGACITAEYEEVVMEGFTPCASSMEEIKLFERLAQSYQKKLKLHLALDTGMGRGGFLPGTSDYAEALQYSSRYIEVEGVGSHMPSSDEDEVFTRQQYESFAKNVPLSMKYRHLENSAGLVHYESSGLNMVRPGLLLYGVSPLEQYQSYLRPVMTLYSRVSLLRRLPAGHSVSYGRTFITQRESMVAVVGIGYADGVRRSISGKGAQVFINGEYAPIIGRITMDQLVIDVTDIGSCEVGDVVEVFGSNILVASFAELAHTIPWEIFTGISPRVRRQTV